VYDTLSRAVAGARVEVLDGPSAGNATITNTDGMFTLTAAINVGGRLRAIKDGYESATTTFQAAPLWLYLAVAGTVNLAGRYTLTVEADPQCADLPPAARKRTYDATVTRGVGSNPSVQLTLTGASLDRYFHVLSLYAELATVHFDLSDNGIVEEIEDETYFTLGGYGTASGATESLISSTFDGVITYCHVKPGTTPFWPCVDDFVTRAQCQSSKHRLTLMRQ
jgi:hypothetical protein